jgi:hypothetical protein
MISPHRRPIAVMSGLAKGADARRQRSTRVSSAEITRSDGASLRARFMLTMTKTDIATNGAAAMPSWTATSVIRTSR